MDKCYSCDGPDDGNGVYTSEGHYLCGKCCNQVMDEMDWDLGEVQDNE